MIGRIKRYAMNGQKCMLSKPLIAHSLVVIFGISAWIGVNGIYVQLPLLVISAPEGWNLAAYVVLMIQAANVGPAAYTLAKKYCSSLNESLCIFTLLFMGSLSMGVLAFFHRETLIIGGVRYSAAMFICVFFIALVGCTSSVLFMPFLRNSDERYLTNYFIGEGLSGVLPSVVAFFQGVGGNPECRDFENGTTIAIISDPEFSSKNFFILLFVIILLSLCSFVLLQYLPFVKKKEESACPDSSDVDRERTAELDRSTFHADNNVRDRYRSDSYEISAKIELSDKEEITMSRTIYLHILVAIICFLGNGFLPSIQTYSCLPYGNVAFHLTVTLANIANPTACLFFLWLNTVNFKILDGLSVVGMLTSIYAIYLAAMSPVPPYRDSTIGVATVVLNWILLMAVISYLKLSITSKIRQKLGSKALIGVGIVMQLGSACGAILSFVLINYTTMFQQHQPCTPL